MLISLRAEAKESLPWTAFFVPSVPNRARRLVGSELLALVESVGPASFLQALMASTWFWWMR